MQLTPARIERGLALATAALTLAAVVFLALGLIREIALDRVPAWLPAGGAAAVAVVAVGHARRLLPRLCRDGEPRWRLAPADATPLLGRTVTGFWIAGGFATYTSPWDWALSALAAVFVGLVVVPALLEGLDRRSAVPRSR